MTTDTKTLIGRAERIDLPQSGIVGLPAKVDTGAYRSSIWATNIHEQNGVLYFTLLGPDSEWYTGKELSTKEYVIVEVENSFGHKEERYSIYLRVRIKGRLVKSNFTLADRAVKTYPVLLGRKLLRHKFIVDVSVGEPIDDEETNGKGGLL
jgi:hypothetical protein